MEAVRALMRQGHSESSAYAIAVENYKRRHGRAPRMHHKIMKANERPIPDVLPESNGNRGTRREVFWTSERVQFETLVELRKVNQTLEKILLELQESNV